MNTLKLLITIFIASTLYTSHSFANDEAISKGSFRSSFSSWGKDSLEGDWTIVKENNQLYIELAENFRAKEGPDVKIFLSPLTTSKLDGNNATNNSILIHQISNFKGKNRIQIPNDIDINDYKSLIFHCEAYSKLWGASPLR